jgi:sugar phosphate isomerase/epimerase
MKRLLSFPDVRDRIDWIGTPEQQRRMLRRFHLDGFEVIWCDRKVEERFPSDAVTGLHLPFYADWMNYWLEDYARLDDEFGDRATWTNFYQGESKEAYIEYLRKALEYAHILDVEYVVFHVSQVAVDEAYDYRFQFDDATVIEESVKLVNALFDTNGRAEEKAARGNPYKFKFLMENLWWPGLNFRDASLTKTLFNGIEYEQKGFALDLGHLLNADTSIRTPADAVAWIHRVLDEHEELLPHIRAVHLHQSMTGAFVEQFCASETRTNGKVNRSSLDYYDRFRLSYEHVAKIDEHAVWVMPGLQPILDRIKPDYLVYEFHAETKEEYFLNLERQNSYFGLSTDNSNKMPTRES